MYSKYKTIFDLFEKTLINYSKDIASSRLTEYKNLVFKKRNNDYYFNKLVLIPFFSGFRASTVEDKIQTIEKHFPDYQDVSKYSISQVNIILSDKEMIKNKKKIYATIRNASVFDNIVETNGSFHNYLESFNINNSIEEIYKLRDDLIRKFSYIGKITSYHFLTEIGLPVIKPDRVIQRIFKRLGLIDEDSSYEDIIKQAGLFATAVGTSYRYIDIVFVKYGQQGKSKISNTDDGICLNVNPKCHLCGVKEFCNYYKTNHLP